MPAPGRILARFFGAIWRAAGRALRGEEKLWRVFWLWGWLLYISSIAFGLLTATYHKDWPWYSVRFVGVLGAILLFIYPFLFCFSLWRCAPNTNRRGYYYAARIYAILLFPALHLCVGFFLLIGTAFFLGAPAAS